MAKKVSKGAQRRARARARDPLAYRKENTAYLKRMAKRKARYRKALQDRYGPMPEHHKCAQCEERARYQVGDVRLCVIHAIDIPLAQKQRLIRADL